MKSKLYIRERILYIDNNCTLSYKKGFLIYRTSNDSQKLKISGGVNSWSLIERVLRKEPRCAARIDRDRILFSFNNKIYIYVISQNAAFPEHEFGKGMHNPLEFLCVKGPRENTIYYGEYIWNEEKGPVSIYKRQNDSWECIYTFPEKTITHIHNIIIDNYRHGFIVLTGDEDNESGIWFANTDFSMVKPILIGSQQYRACVAFPTNEGIYYATDTPLEDNKIYFAKLDKFANIIDLKTEYPMPGPCIYGCIHNDKMFFSTSVEPDASLSTWRYRMTYRLGNGVKDRNTHIIVREENGKYMEIYKIKKDLLPIWLFQFGNIIYPKNDSESLYAVLQSTSEGHGVTIQLVENEEKYNRSQELTYE